MQIDIDDKEARVLLVALHAYRSYLHNEAEELAAIEKARAERKNTYPPPLDYCCCCIDLVLVLARFARQLVQRRKAAIASLMARHSTNKVKIPYYRDSEFCVQLRDKLRMHQMMFPCEEHETKPGYSVGYLPGSPFCYKEP